MMWKPEQRAAEAEDENNTADSANEAGTESIASPMDPSAQLESELKTAKAEVAEWQDRFLRKAAELENYRKRSEKEKADSMLLAKSAVLIEFLPVADACERALKIFDEDRNVPVSLQQYQEGVELLYKQVLDALGRAGATAMEAEGQPFDPHRHEALSREESPDFEEGTVIRELRRGYLFKDRLLRPAQVIVAVHPKGNKQRSQ
jgi:molecular chaperone GrpE